MDHNIYEEMYERLLSEGLDEDIATAVVNKMHDREELHDVEYIDEGVFKAATTIGRVAAKMMGFGKVSSQAARGAGVCNIENFKSFDLPFLRGIRRANWTLGRALPSGTPAGLRNTTLKNLTKGTKSNPLLPRAKGGPIVTTGTVTVTVPKADRLAAGQTKAATAAAGSKGTGVTYQGTRSGGQLPPAGQTTSRLGRAQEKLKGAAQGSTAVGTRYTSQGVRQLGPEKLASKVKRTVSNLKNTLAGAGAATVKGAKKGATAVNKLPTGAKLAAGAALVGVTAAGLGVGDPVAKKTGEINLPNKDTAPTTPPGGVVADKGKKDDTKGPGGYTIPDAAKPKTDGSVGKTFDPGKDLVPKSETPRKLSKMERNARELKQMRARSLDRQGRSSDAEKLRAEIKKKYDVDPI